MSAGAPFSDDLPYIYHPNPYPDYIEALLDGKFNVLDDTNLSQYASKVVALFICPQTSVTPSLLDSLPALKVVGNCAVGYDNVDLKACKERGIRVGNTPNTLNDTTADMGLALLLCVARRVVEGDKILHSQSLRDETKLWNWYGKQVSGATAGVIGLGRIGFEVAKRLKGFDMKILYHGRSRKPLETEAAVGATYVPNLYDMLGQSDYVILVAPATAKTRHLMGAKEFEAMKNDAIFVNISRGTLVNQEALVGALETGGIGGAGLDVTDPEPLPIEHKLFSFPNVVITPHTGSATAHTRRKMFMMTIDNIMAGLRGEEMPSEVTA